MANRNIFIVLYLDRVTFITDMNNNENTVKYCLNIANEICAGGASLLAEAVFVCIDFLKIFCKKCVENLAVTKYCVISLSLSLSLSLIATRKIYKIPFNFQWVTNNIFFEKSSNSVYTTFSSKHHKIAIRLWRYAATWVCHVRISPFLRICYGKSGLN